MLPVKNPYEHEDCDDITGCGDKCNKSAWVDGLITGIELAANRMELWECEMPNNQTPSIIIRKLKEDQNG